MADIDFASAKPVTGDAIDFASAKPVAGEDIDFASAKPVVSQASPQNWSAGDYGQAALRAGKNLLPDIGQLYGEMLTTGGNLVGAAMHPVETAKKIGKAAEAQAKVVGGEILLGAKSLGLPIKVRPGKEREAAQFIDSAKNLNLVVSNSSIGKAAQGDFGPLITEVSNRPAHALLNAAIATKSLAGLAEKAGMTEVAANLGKAEAVINPITLPGRIGQAARSTAIKASNLADLATEYGVEPEAVGKVGDVLYRYGTTPTVGQVLLKQVPNIAGGLTGWYGKIFDPQSNWLRKTYGSDLAAAREMLKTSPAYSETGVMLTPAERTLGLGRVEAPAGEAGLLSRAAPTELDRRELARKASLGKEVAPLAEGLSEAETARDLASAENYAKVDQRLVTSDLALENLLKRAKRAVAKAKEAAEANGVPFSHKLDIRSETEKAYGVGRKLSTEPTTRAGKRGSYTVGEVAPAKRDPITGQLKTTEGYDPVTGERVGERVGAVTTSKVPATTGGGTSPATAVRQYSGKSLKEIDMALNDLASLPPGAEGITANLANTFGNLRKDLRAYLFRDDVLPELKTAVEAHTEHSRNIDRIKVGQYVQNLVSDIHNPEGEKRFLDYWKTIKEKDDASKLIKDATGNTVVKSLTGENSLGFDDSAMQRFKNIASDLERRREYMRQAEAGSGADVKMGEKFGVIPHTLTAPGMLVNAFLRAKGESLSKKAATDLANLVFNEGGPGLISAFDKAIKSGNQSAFNAAYTKAKMLQAESFGRKAAEKYSTVGGQAVKQFLNPKYTEVNDMANDYGMAPNTPSGYSKGGLAKKYGLQ